MTCLSSQSSRGSERGLRCSVPTPLFTIIQYAKSHRRFPRHLTKQEPKELFVSNNTGDCERDLRTVKIVQARHLLLQRAELNYDLVVM